MIRISEVKQISIMKALKQFGQESSHTGFIKTSKGYQYVMDGLKQYLLCIYHIKFGYNRLFSNDESKHMCNLSIHPQSNSDDN